MILLLTKGSQVSQTKSTLIHWSSGVRPKWMGSALPVIIYNEYYQKISIMNLLSALRKCLNAVSPRPPIAHTIYWLSLVGSIVVSHVVSAELKKDRVI